MRNILSLIVISCISYSCSFFEEDDSIEELETEVITNNFELGIQKKLSSSSWLYCPIGSIDISEIPNIDSVIFRPNLRSQSNEERCVAELFNLETQSIISGSSVQSNQRYVMHFVRSQNLVFSFPQKSTNFSLRVRSTVENHHVEIGTGSRVIVYSH